MQRIDKIVFIADFLRFSEAAKSPNATIKSAQWLSQMLEFPLACVLPEMNYETIWHNNGLDALDFYMALSTPASFQGWASVLNNQEVNEKLDSLVKKKFENTLVIGCELPEIICRSFCRNNITFLDTVASPIRFSKDIINCWRSNHPEIQKEIAKFKYDDALHYYHANLIRAKFIWAKTESIETETAVIIGQVSDDKSLIDKNMGRVVALSDYHSQIHSILDNHQNILYKAHPYSKPDEFIQNIIDSNKYNVSTTDTNYYQLLCTKNINHIYGINSGSLTEAKYFKKMSTAFKEPLYDIAKTFSEAQKKNTPVEIAHEWLTPSFWAKILAPILPVKSNDLPNMSTLDFTNTIRRSLNADWNFGQINKIKV